jgi:L-fucono-1,5-lactonase
MTGVDAVIDAHHHLWDPTRRPYDWMTGPLEPLRKPRGLDDLRAVTGQAGVTGTVVVEAATEERETVELLALAEASGGLVRAVVGWVDLTAPDVADRIAALRESPGGQRLTGFRHHVQDEPNPEWLLRDDVLRGLNAVAAAGLRYDLLVRPPQLPAARRVAELVEDLPLVVDHGAKPEIATSGWEPWSAELARLAAVERVHCKLSGLVTEARWDRWREDGIERYAARLLELFGPRRLMFGSDWPVCTLAASYDEVLELARTALAALSAAEQGTILHDTAERFYALDSED